MSDSLEHLKEGFADALAELPHDIAVNMAPDVARALGRDAARSAVASLVWSARLGDTLNTTQVATHLKLSRQALAKRLHAGTIVGLPGRGTTLYPVWQFKPTLDEVRAEAREILKIFANEPGGLNPYTVSAWMKTSSEDLNGLTPEEWLLKKDDPQPLYDAARRTVGRLAS
ncbi:MAG TPA: hypothetical protein VFW50_32325 [Streptosporangiaceae bacterium]|nr:hypothetical protein [Streptosporangiaceae bacterium]